MFSLLFDMNELWQAAMLSRLRRDCARVGAENPEAQRYRVFWRSNDGTARKHIQPDIVVPAGRDPPTIVDTKWKVLASPTPGDEDLRQTLCIQRPMAFYPGHTIVPTCPRPYRPRSGHTRSLSTAPQGIATLRLPVRTLWTGLPRILWRSSA